MTRNDRISEIFEVLEKENVRFIDMAFTDIHGKLKKIAIPVERAQDAMESGILFDGSSIDGYAPIEESDLKAMPVLDSFMVYPWTKGQSKTARFMCDIYYPDKNDRYEGDPRYILQRQLDRAEKMGFRFFVGPEYEFFLFKYDENGNPTNIPPESMGYFDMGANDITQTVRQESVSYIQQMGYEVEAEHHEVAPGQHEIDLKYGDAMQVADSISTLKYVVKTAADRHNLFASFMPKPIADQNGNGMHVNQSLAYLEPRGESSNAFWDPNGKYELSKTAMNYLAGLIGHVKEATAIYNAYVNSYKRLAPGFEAPVYITWARKNRTTLIRVPAGRRNATRFELRSPDPAGNPYLMFAVMLASGLEGIEKGMEPPEPVELNIFTMDDTRRKELNIESLPGSLGEALLLLEESKFVKDVLGEYIFHQFLVQKRREWNQYRTQITEWELKTHLPTL